jgi:hypothetical protein
MPQIGLPCLHTDDFDVTEADATHSPVWTVVVVVDPPVLGEDPRFEHRVELTAIEMLIA